MGSLRNPIGPLPSSIYWRRRAVALSLAALLLVLTIWAVTSRGGGGGKDDSANGTTTPAPSITPGPSQSGPAISEQPGGRESSDSGSGASSAPGAGSSSGAGPGGSEGTDGGGSDGGAGTGGQGTGGGSGSGGTGGAAGQRVPVSSSLPNCAPSDLKLTLRSLKVSYELGEKPSFQLIVANTSSTTCKADFGPRAAVLTVKDTRDDDVWSSKDCPKAAGPQLLRVPAGQTISHTVEWDRKQSEPGCATPSTKAASAGTYLVEAAVPGVTVLPVSFRLEKD